MKNNKGFGVIGIILIIVGILVVSSIVNYSRTDSKVNIVTNFNECVEEGNLVMESHPRQCRHGNETFIEIIDDDILTEKDDETFTKIIDDNSVIQKENNVAPSVIPADRYDRYISKDCKIFSGCNGPIHCVDKNFDENIATTCEFKPEYVCYATSTARCEKQTSGKCRWTDTAELQSCISVYQNKY